MNQESFKQTLEDHCREEVRELYYECTHYGEFDAKDFNYRLINIWAEAKISGVLNDDFMMIVKSILDDKSEVVEYPFEEMAA